MNTPENIALKGKGSERNWIFVKFIALIGVIHLPDFPPN